MAAYRVPLKLNLKQSYPRILNPRPLPAKPIRFSCSASTPPPKFKDVKLQCLLSKKQNADSKSGGHNASLVHYSPQWLLNLIKDKWPAAANPNMKKNLCESLKKRAMAAVVLLGLLLMYNNNSKPALAAPVGRVGANGTVVQYSISHYGITTFDPDTYSTCDLVLCHLLCYIVVAVSVMGVWHYGYCMVFCVFFLPPLFIYNGRLSGRTSVVKVQLQVYLKSFSSGEKKNP
jgi:hypothetical protein